jgi:hypothetical protein
VGGPRNGPASAYTWAQPPRRYGEGGAGPIPAGATLAFEVRPRVVEPFCHFCYRPLLFY